MRTIARALAVVLIGVLSVGCLTSGGSGLAADQYTLTALPAAALHHVRNFNGTSTNWSGYAAETNFATPPAGSVSDVKGTWVVPTATGSGTTTAYSSAWVGIDGYSDTTVEQIGTDADWSKRGGGGYYAWFEMYPQGAYQINRFPVEPGDKITGEVHYANNNQFTLTITNVTRKVSFSTTMRSATAKRTSAEWVMEAPSSNTGVLPLANFHTINFSGCTATISGHTAGINSPLWKNDLIKMETSTGVMKAVPSALSTDGSSFSVVWDHQ